MKEDFEEKESRMVVKRRITDKDGKVRMMFDGG